MGQHFLSPSSITEEGGLPGQQATSRTHERESSRERRSEARRGGGCATDAEKEISEQEAAEPCTAPRRRIDQVYRTQRCRLGDGLREAGGRYGQVPGLQGQNQPRPLVGRLPAKNSSRLLVGVTALARAGAPQRCPCFFQPATAASTPGRVPCYLVGVTAAFGTPDARWLRSGGPIATARRQTGRPRRVQHECCHRHGNQLLDARRHQNGAVDKRWEASCVPHRHWLAHSLCCGRPFGTAGQSRLSA